MRLKCLRRRLLSVWKAVGICLARLVALCRPRQPLLPPTSTLPNSPAILDGQLATPWHFLGRPLKLLWPPLGIKMGTPLKPPWALPWPPLGSPLTQPLHPNNPCWAAGITLTASTINHPPSTFPPISSQHPSHQL